MPVLIARRRLGGGNFLRVPFSDNFAEAVLGQWYAPSWAISSGAAVNTPTLGSNLVVNGGFAADANWSKGTGWSIGSNVATHAGATAGDLQQYPLLTTGTWYRIDWTITAITTEGVRIQNDSRTNTYRTSAATYVDTLLAFDVDLTLWAAANNDASVDDVSAKAISLPSLFAFLARPTASADVTISVAATITANTQAGVVLSCDSRTNPQNFVVAYHDGNTCRLDKCVAGTYTSVISASATYGDGRVIKVIKSGTSYSLYYNNIQVGTTQTISDAAIIGNKIHGMFSTAASNSLDTFSLTR